MKKFIIILGGFLLLVAWPTMAAAQSGNEPYHKEPFNLDTGTHSNPGRDSVTAFQAEIRVLDAPWLRVHISDYNLGQNSYLTLTSLKDGGQQRLDTKNLPQWGNTSAYFNGEAVMAELHVAPGDQNVFFRVEELTVGEWVEIAEEELSIESICGAADNRVPSNDARSARLTFVFASGNPNNACTAWLVSNGSLLTAGHCVDFDPDGFGPGLPDGTLNLDGNDVIEFDVPASTSGGNLVFADPNDQYPINLGSVQWNFDGEGQGLGKDWAVFDVFGNNNSRKGPHQVQGFYRTTNGNPTIAASTMRITGFGTDSTPNLTRNQTQQTHTGPYRGENSAGGDIWHTYQVDTTGGNSGSPIIWNNNGFTVGIHTNAGCGNPVGTSANSGTSFEHNPLENTLDNFPGSNTVYTDKIRFGAAENGTIFHPYDTVLEAVNSASSGAIISIVTGSYDETMTLGDDSKTLILDAPVGNVIIGD